MILREEREFNNKGFYLPGEGNGNYCFGVAKCRRFHRDSTPRQVSLKSIRSQLFTSFYPELTPVSAGLTMVFEAATDDQTK
jgi:hypothetical protein